MHCHFFKIVPANWRKLISDRFYGMRNSKLKNIVTKIVEIQVKITLGVMKPGDLGMATVFNN